MLKDRFTSTQRYLAYTKPIDNFRATQNGAMAVDASYLKLGGPAANARRLGSGARRFGLGSRLSPTWALVALAAVGAPSLALAQSGSYFDRSNNVSVTDRPKPDYQAPGLNVGAFTVNPSLTVTPEYDDNIFATHDDRQGDFITQIKPTVSISSNWSRNALGATASAVSNVYADHTGENTTDYSVAGSGRLDILSSDNITGGLGYSHNTISRTGENTFNGTLEPIQYDIVNGTLGAQQTLNRLRFTEGLTFAHVSYDSTADDLGNPIDLSYLNSNTTEVSGQANYALNPEISVFASGSFNDRSYTNMLPINEVDRSSHGTEFDVGSTFDITRLIRGSVSVGYLEQNYDSATFHTVSGPSVHVHVEYFLSGLTTLGFSANRSIVDAVDPIAVSYFSTQAAFSIDHELLRNLILSGRVSYETDDFTGDDRHDNRASFSTSATYLMNRNWSFVLGYSFLNEGSSGVDRIPSYLVNLVSFSIVFRL